MSKDVCIKSPCCGGTGDTEGREVLEEWLLKTLLALVAITEV